MKLMVTSKIQQLQKYQKKVAALERELSRARRKLLALPSKLGYKSVNALIEALKEASTGRSVSPTGKTKRKRAKITPETKAEVKKLVGMKKTGGAIAKALGISLPSVQNIKKELGLVKKRP